MPISFAVAAAAHEVSEDDDIVEVPIENKVYIATRPTSAQAALLASAQLGTPSEQTSAIFGLVRALLGPEALQHIRRLIWEGRIDMGDIMGGSDQNPDGGLIDSIFSEFQGEDRPSRPSSGSASSQPSGGRRSTGRSPGKGSTRSTSPSTAS